MVDRRNALTPDALQMMDAIARSGSFAAAARELGKVPSALTYSVRQLEDALDVLLFDRRSGQAKFTAAGEELLNEGRRLLAEMEAVTNRVKRVSTGWESTLTIAADGVISRLTLLELCEAFYSLRPDGEKGPSTRLRLRTEVMTGTWEALTSGHADLAIGVMYDGPAPPGIEQRALGEMRWLFAVAPHHPLAQATEPITDTELLNYRAVAVADSAQRLSPRTVNLLPGQDVLTVASLQAKIEAQIRCLGCGFIPEAPAREHLRAGRLVEKRVQRATPPTRAGYAWRASATPQPKKAPQGLALAWWLEQLDSAATRQALLERPSAQFQAID